MRKAGFRYSTLRWPLVPWAAFGGFAAGFLLIAGGGALLRLVLSEAQIEAVLPLDLRVGVLGGVAAFGTVVAAAATAPSAKRRTALVVFAVGAGVAWFLLNPWWFPESHPRAYQRSHLPLVGTYIGGVLGLVGVALRTSHPWLRRLLLGAKGHGLGGQRMRGPHRGGV
jgi:hypothetical protein